MGPLLVFGSSVLFAVISRLAGTRRPEPQRDAYGMLLGAPGAAGVLRSAALAPAGSWTQRNVLQAGAADSMRRRLGGTASEADFAVLRAARPGIASSTSGPISGAWSGSPWGSGGPVDAEAIADRVLAQDDLED